MAIHAILRRYLPQTASPTSKHFNDCDELETARAAVRRDPTSLPAWYDFTKVLDGLRLEHDASIARREALLLEFLNYARTNGAYLSVPLEVWPGIGRAILVDTVDKDDTRPPSILLTTLPRSGSTYLMESLVEGLDYIHVPMSAGVFPQDVLCPTRTQFFAGGKCVARHHVSPLPPTLWCLRRYNIIPIVHIRDPREATHSWTRYSEKARFTLAPPLGRLPEKFFSAPESWQIDYMIDTMLPAMCKWIVDWVAAAEKVPVLFTQYAELYANPEGLWAKLLAHIGLDATEHPYPFLSKTSARNFRSGEPAEWRRTYSRDQTRRAKAAVPPALLERFGWEP